LGQYSVRPRHHLSRVWPCQRHCIQASLKNKILFSHLGTATADCLKMQHSSLNIYDLCHIFPNLTHLDLRAVGKLAPPPPPPPPPPQQQQQQQLQPFAPETVLKHIPEHVELTHYLNDEIQAFSSSSSSSFSSLQRYNVFKRTNKLWYLDERRSVRASFLNDLMTIHSGLRIIDDITLCIRVDEMLRKPWACMGLEKLACQIVGVERLTRQEEVEVVGIMSVAKSPLDVVYVLSEEERSLIQRFQRSRAQQQAVFKQLARLTRLKVLDLGYENRDPWTYKSGMSYEVDGKDYLEYIEEPVFDTLELSLDSGLNQLGSLKNMEIFGFECINHRIGEVEVAWMAKSWPRLKTMRGLAKEELYDIEPCKVRLALRTYMKRLRSDVEHTTLFQDDI
ncbi:hypothetical protein BG004_005029, partial [Podila humilis]